MKKELSFEAFYPDPPERVWQALTDPKALAKWLMPTTFKPQIGFRFRFEGLGRSNGNSVEGQVIELKEARKLTYTWDDGEDDMESFLGRSRQRTGAPTLPLSTNRPNQPSRTC